MLSNLLSHSRLGPLLLAALLTIVELLVVALQRPQGLMLPLLETL